MCSVPENVAFVENHEHSTVAYRARGTLKMVSALKPDEIDHYRHVEMAIPALRTLWTGHRRSLNACHFDRNGLNRLTAR